MLSPMAGQGLTCGAIRTYVRPMKVPPRADAYAERVRRARAEVEGREAEEEQHFAPVRAEVAELQTMDPGPALVARLDELAQQPMDQATRLELVACYKRARAWFDAQEMAAVARAVGPPGRDGYAWAVSDLAALTHTTEYSASAQVTLMQQVSRALPLCWEAMNAGTLTLAHVRAVAGPTELCSDELTK